MNNQRQFLLSHFYQDFVSPQLFHDLYDKTLSQSSVTTPLV